MRILVAEDDALSRTLLVRVLGDMGHAVTPAADGALAWEAFRKAPYPVVITDWLMPKCDGLELTRRIRGVRTCARPWIVMLSGLDFAANFRKTMDAGVDDFLVKPLDPDLLRARLTLAARATRMGEQVTALVSALPVCMRCKAARDAGDRWERLKEEFHDIDFSPGYCPDCFHQHSLRPELARLRASPEWARRLTAVDPLESVDSGVLATLTAFDQAESPGLVEAMRSKLVQSADALRRELEAYGAAGLLDGDALERIERFASRAEDLGLGRLPAALRRLTTRKPDQPLTLHQELALAAGAELEAALAALEGTRASQPAV